ncbi:MAG: lipoyl(octanoyl) transferase LipB [Pseudomonadota bacterium]
MYPVVIKDLGVTDYQPVFESMQAFTESRDQDTLDEVWLTEHRPVFTQGQAGKAEHVLAPGDIPVVQTDRGGQVTYHGPGQITAYLLFDLRRRKLGVRDLVTGIEQSMVATTARYGIDAQPRADAPGVYVAGDKIGSLGLRVRRGCSYHGLSLNVQMELEPFSRINPCGLMGVAVTHMAEFSKVDFEHVKSQLLEDLFNQYQLEHTSDSPHAA